MKEQGRINSYQFFCLVFLFVVGSSVILQSLTAAGRDTWISTGLAMAAGLFTVFVICYTSKIFPGMNLIEYTQKLFGKIPGKIIGTLYLFYFLYLGALVLRNYGDLLSSVVMPESPGSYFNLTLALVIMFLVYNRLEVMGRVGEIILPISMFIFILMSIFISLSEITEYKNLLPILENGIGKLILGTVPIAAFPFQEVVAFTMVLPYVNSFRKGAMAFAGAMTLGGIFLIITLMQTIAVFGLYTSTLTFPRIFAVRMIAVGEIIQRIEAGVLGAWIMGGMIKIGVCLYAFVLGLSILLGIKDYKTLIVPSTFLMVVLANLSFKNVFEMLNFAVNIYPVYAFPFQVIFPLLILVFGIIKTRKKKGAQPGQKQQKIQS